jgi:hypothetical protein
MPARRRKASAPPPVTREPTGEITAAFERTKQAFLTRNAERCPYVLVQVQPDLANQRLTLVASYAFSDARDWQQVEAHIPIAALTAEAGPELRFAEAFVRLDDGIGAARIARLFAPRTTAQDLAIGQL